MHETSNDNWSQSNNERLLYSVQRAFDEVINLGAIPERLYRVLYPIWRINIEGRQRIARNYEEVEHFIERGIHEIELQTIGELSEFYGLDTDYIQKLVNFLHSIGHIRTHRGLLCLTKLGIDSIAEETFFEEHETSAILYFDGLGSRLLSRAHYNVPIYTDPPDNQNFHCLDLFSTSWNDKELKSIITLSEKRQYGLPDEISQIRLIGQQPAYLPIYIVYCSSTKDNGLPPYLVFSRIRGLRDEIIEEAINLDSSITNVPLREPSREDKLNAVTKRMESFGLTLAQWELIEDSHDGIKVIVAADVFELSENSLKIENLGEYILAQNWCVWLTSADPEIRQQAVIEQLLNWLQKARLSPSNDQWKNRMNFLCNRLETLPISEKSLMDFAKKFGYGNALNRLDLLLSD